MSYEDLKIEDQSIEKITILEFVEKYKLRDRYPDIYPFLENIDINVYKTTDNSYIPFIHTKNILEIGKTYQATCYKDKDKFIYVHCIKKLN